ncbi:hypothetical protein BGZ61DRAFT_453566 [Ilyonectria robusta]|uniref:uncharacterized protein n=1 Tax=Ilyonectria robusta TaxID=1079257 RepID=UPI001E8E5CC5|nr:uncharacterized protein BGZ61DRAFT_453566 [Ilyonectria robusta]KAH8686745.1 hypothetical protein BGZ61DRAFT_453566 [Ilyonectria robusta]
MVDCDVCDRFFKTSSALRQHLEASQTQHPTCNRHDRIFASWSALQQHIDDSQFHNICDICPDDDSDFPTSDMLYDHKVEEHDYCNECQVQFISSSQLIEHDVSEHNMCETCSRCFATPSNLLNHRKTHAEKSVECPGCTRFFISDSAMVLHLETGGCASGTNRSDVCDIAFDCYQSGHYTCDDDRDFDFSCPTCDVPFLFMSALLQHAESEACDETLEWYTALGKFLHFLRQRI